MIGDLKSLLRLRLFTYLLLLLFFPSCRPMGNVNLTLPNAFIEEEGVDRCMDDRPLADLNCWWRQFDDPLLIDLIEKALCCNYDIRIAKERICESRAIFRIEFSSLLPQIDAFILFSRIRNSQTLSESAFTGGTFINFYQAGFDSFWELDIFGKKLDRARAAGYDIVASEEHVRDVNVSISAEVAVNYFVIRSIQNRIDIALRHLKAAEELMELTRDRLEAGLISQLDYYTAKALVETRRSELPVLQIRLQQTIYSLAVLLGEIPEKLTCCFGEKKVLPCIDGKIPLGLPSDLLCRRGDVRQAEFLLRATGARVLAARKEFFPTISLQGIFSYATGFFTSWTEAESKDWMILPSLTLPLFHGGKILANIAAETSRQRQAVLEYEKIVLYALKEVENGLVSFFQEGARLSELKQEVESYKEAREIAKILYTAGRVDFLYVIQVEDDLFFAEIMASESREKIMTDLTAIYKALGGGFDCCAML